MKFIKDHVEYLKDNPEGYWFKRKLYGWGWTPAKLAGWILLGLYILVIGWLAWNMEKAGAEPSAKDVASLIAVTVLFLVIIWRTGEPLKWQWGKGVKDEEEKDV